MGAKLFLCFLGIALLFLIIRKIMFFIKLWQVSKRCTASVEGAFQDYTNNSVVVSNTGEGIAKIKARYLSIRYGYMVNDEVYIIDTTFLVKRHLNGKIKEKDLQRKIVYNPENPLEAIVDGWFGENIKTILWAVILESIFISLLCIV